jgi:FdrA protein
MQEGSAMTDHVEVRRRTYHDSVRLMQASAALQAVPGVETALVAMATEMNLGLLADLGFGEVAAGPDDMVIAVRAAAADAVAAALAALEGALTAVTTGGSMEAPAPRSIGRAAALIGADLALVSVPGPSAFVEAMEALDEGLHVMIFSDNVAVEHERILKERGRERGLLVMGPDCGTAVVGGIGLGFANVVQPGPVGIVGASGTGTQELCCLLDAAGVGVRHALGTGSRDLSAEIGGMATLQGLEGLDRDPGTEVIVIVSKPPAPEVAEKVREAAAACATTTVTALIGEETLEQGTAAVLAALGVPVPDFPSWPAEESAHRPGRVYGLFSGGTLRGEAAVIASATLGPIGSGLDDAGHTMIDLGEDEFTLGRPHPMIDQRFRLEHLERAAADPGVGVILLDLVLGHGAHPDPAAEMAPAVAAAVRQGAAVVVSLCGSSGDTQGVEYQAETMAGAGASVYLSNAAAAAYAVDLAGGGR